MKSILAFFILAITLGTSGRFESSKVLEVPYKVQPNGKTCQSACLKMMGMYYNVPDIGSADIRDIYATINEGKDRPDKNSPNSWTNILWWLNSKAPGKKFILFKTKDEAEAIEHIVKSIGAGNPVILSTNNFRTRGHLVLVVGYYNYFPNQSSTALKFICHDPYGQFFPELLSNLYGEKRYDFGMSLPDGDEIGPGKGVEITATSLKRFRDDEHHKKHFVIIGASE